MTKIAKIFLVLLLVFLLKHSFITSSFASYTKNQNNPILGIGAAGQWDSSSISDPYVIYEQGIYKMWYTGNNSGVNSVGQSTSSDGSIWTKVNPNPIFIKNTSDPSELDIGVPKILKIDNEYKMWYLSTAPYTSPGNEVYRIKLASSPNGVDNWTTQGYAFRRSSATWESEGVVPNTILYHNNKYELWYSARDSGGIWRIGYADSNDGINWTRQLNPVLIANQPWEGTTVAAASVLLQGGIYHMYYHAGPVVPYYLGHATSTDGINWTKDPNPVLERGGFGAFDRNMIAAPSVIRDANKLRIYYAGHDGTKWQIGLAEEIVPIPYYSQSDPLWGDNTYDHMDTTMSEVGCAVTSAAMVLRAFNVTKTPGDSSVGLPAKDLTPGTLNEWLTETNDGSFRNGITNFASIARMTEKSHKLDPTSPKLDYSQGFALTDIDTELDDNRYPILKLSYPPSPSDMHFVVATGSATSNYSILDPYYENRKELYPDYSTVLRVDKFTPTNSDFSYLIFAVNENVNLELVNSLGESIGQAQLERPIFDQVHQTSSNAETLNVLYFKQPPSDDYTLRINSPSNQPYQLDSYFYTQEGEVKTSTNRGDTGPNQSVTYQIDFDKLNVEQTEITKQVTFDTLKQDIKYAYEQGWVNTQIRYKALLAQATAAEKLANRGLKNLAAFVLKALKLEIQYARPKYISQEAKDLLIPDIDQLLSQF